MSRICDVCGKPATDKVKIERQQQEFDVCEEHTQEVLKTLQRIEDRLKRGRPKKDSE